MTNFRRTSRQIGSEKGRTQLSRCAFAATALALTLALPVSASYRGEAPVQRAEVLSVDPVFETVEISEPHELCREEQVPFRSDARYDDRHASRKASTYRSRTPGVLGAIVGGAIGHSVGNGKTNKRIGTAVGAILGGSIGADISRRNHRSQLRQQEDRWQDPRGYGGYEPIQYRTQRVCEIVTDTRIEQRVSAYDVAYAYGGETYTTVLDYDPGRYLEVRVRVTPVN